MELPNLWLSISMRGSRGGGTGGPDPLKNHKNIGFLSNTGPDTLERIIDGLGLIRLFF